MRILVIRFSAMGDVALLLPVLYSVAERFADDRFVLLTKDAFIPLCEHRPPNISVFPLCTNARHKGLLGLLRLLGDLSKENFDAVADMHNVLRSQLIRTYFRLRGKQVHTLNKGRREKHALVRQRHKRLQPLTTSIDRYRNVFRALNRDCPLTFRSIFRYGNNPVPSLHSLIPLQHIPPHDKGVYIGVAPFARHKGKTYPLAKTEAVVEALARNPLTAVFLFGSSNEAPLLNTWANKYERVVCIAGRLPLTLQLVAMRSMDTMLTMDSANMHLASLVGVTVVSVWGATHPFAGFLGYRQSLLNAVQLDLPCRPCSVFGNKPCRHGHYPCLTNIPPQTILAHLSQLL